MLKRLLKRWVFGWLLLLNLVVVGFLINIVLFFAFVPASLLLQANNEPKMDAALRTLLVVLGIVYGLVVSPLAMTWIVKWKGFPTWGSWENKQ